MVLTELGSAAEVLVATGHDPFARGSLRRHVTRGWVVQGATAWIGVDPDERMPYLSALGAPERVAALLADLLPELPPRQRLTVPRGTAALLPAWVGLEGMTHWEFRWTSSPPPEQPGEDRVEAGVPDAEVTPLLEAASPRASALPGDAAVSSWWGVRLEPAGRLVACAADTSAATAVGHLSSIAVDPQHRGRGLGRAVTAAAIRARLTGGCDLVTLGMYADNDAGRALYDALGLVDDHRFTSGRLVQRSRW